MLYHECSVAKLCPTLCDPMDCRTSGSSVHGICPASILDWVAISLSNLSLEPLVGMVQPISGRLRYPQEEGIFSEAPRVTLSLSQSTCGRVPSKVSANRKLSQV